MDLTVIDETGARAEQVSVPDTVAAGRIAARLVALMGLPLAGADGQPIAYGFRHEASGRQIGDEETLAQARVNDNDVLRLAPVPPRPGPSSAPGRAEAQPREPAPTPGQASAAAQPAETAVLSPTPPPPARQSAAPTRMWHPSIAIALAVLAVALIGVAVAILVSRGGQRETRLLAHDVPPETAGTSSSSTTPGGGSSESTSTEAGKPATTSTAEEKLPDVPTQQMQSEIQQVLRNWHEDVVRGDYHAAWELLSRRKQVQAEGEGGYGAWARNQSTLRPYLDPAGLQVSLRGTEAEPAVAEVDVTGMRWNKPGASCGEWSGITWVKYENGEWRYDPGYSTTQQREREWKSHYTELLGGSC